MTSKKLKVEAAPPPEPKYLSPEQIRDISEQVYRIRLGADDVRRMLEKDNDGGKKLRIRAASYDVLTRAYLDVLGIEKPKPNTGKKKS